MIIQQHRFTLTNCRDTASTHRCVKTYNYYNNLMPIDYNIEHSKLVTYNNNVIRRRKSVSAY